MRKGHQERSEGQQVHHREQSREGQAVAEPKAEVLRRGGAQCVPQDAQEDDFLQALEHFGMALARVSESRCHEAEDLSDQYRQNNFSRQLTEHAEQRQFDAGAEEPQQQGGCDKNTQHVAQYGVAERRGDWVNEEREQG